MSKKVMAVVAVVALIAILGICLVACNAESYEKKLEKKGYTVVTSEADEEDGVKIEWMVNGTKKGDGLLKVDNVTIVKYANTDDAKDAESDAKKVLGEDCVYRIGKILIAGTEQGVKDAK